MERSIEPSHRARRAYSWLRSVRCRSRPLCARESTGTPQHFFLARLNVCSDPSAASARAARRQPARLLHLQAGVLRTRRRCREKVVDRALRVDQYEGNGSSTLKGRHRRPTADFGAAGVYRAAYARPLDTK